MYPVVPQMYSVASVSCVLSCFSRMATRSGRGSGRDAQSVRGARGGGPRRCGSGRDAQGVRGARGDGRRAAGVRP
eukprot:2310342-Rhodomonas_salina.1